MMKRLFAAIKINPDQDFLTHYYHIRKALQNDTIKWVEPENMHLTLKFFGDTEEEKISDIAKVIEPIALAHEPFTIHLTDVGIFGSRYNPRVIWIGLKEYDQLKNLGLALLHQLNLVGFPQDRQNFVPHLTIGRIKQITDKAHFQKNIDKFKKTFFQEVEVREITLMESILKPEGPQYFSIEKYILG